MENKETPQVRGRKFELRVLRKLKEWGYKKLGRTILVDKKADNAGIDIKARTENKVSLNIQCKASSKIPRYPIVLHNIPQSDGVTNVIFHEYWWKGSVVNTYAILTADEFMELINREV